MKSKYGIRLYELLKSVQNKSGEIKYTLSELRDRLDVSNYNRFPDFRRYVLDNAIYDINECSDIHVDYKAAKSTNSRQYDVIIFEVSSPTYLDEKLRAKRKQAKLDKEQKRIRQDMMNEIKNNMAMK